MSEDSNFYSILIRFAKIIFERFDKHSKFTLDELQELYYHKFGQKKTEFQMLCKMYLQNGFFDYIEEEDVYVTCKNWRFTLSKMSSYEKFKNIDFPQNDSIFIQKNSHKNSKFKNHSNNQKSLSLKNEKTQRQLRNNHKKNKIVNGFSSDNDSLIDNYSNDETNINNIKNNKKNKKNKNKNKNKKNTNENENENENENYNENEIENENENEIQNAIQNEIQNQIENDNQIENENNDLDAQDNEIENEDNEQTDNTSDYEEETKKNSKRKKKKSKKKKKNKSKSKSKNKSKNKNKKAKSKEKSSISIKKSRATRTIGMLGFLILDRLLINEQTRDELAADTGFARQRICTVLSIFKGVGIINESDNENRNLAIQMNTKQAELFFKIPEKIAYLYKLHSKIYEASQSVMSLLGQVKKITYSIESENAENLKSQFMKTIEPIFPKLSSLVRRNRLKYPNMQIVNPRPTLDRNFDPVQILQMIPKSKTPSKKNKKREKRKKPNETPPLAFEMEEPEKTTHREHAQNTSFTKHKEENINANERDLNTSLPHNNQNQKYFLNEQFELPYQDEPAETFGQFSGFSSLFSRENPQNNFIPNYDFESEQDQEGIKQKKQKKKHSSSRSQENARNSNKKHKHDFSESDTIDVAEFLGSMANQKEENTLQPWNLTLSPVLMSVPSNSSNIPEIRPFNTFSPIFIPQTTSDANHEIVLHSPLLGPFSPTIQQSMAPNIMNLPPLFLTNQKKKNQNGNRSGDFD